MKILFYFSTTQSSNFTKTNKWNDLFTKIKNRGYDVDILFADKKHFEFLNKISIKKINNNINLSSILSFFSNIILLKRKINFLKTNNILNIILIFKNYIFWNSYLSKTKIKAIYLMNPRELIYNYDTIILEHTCSLKNIGFHFIRETFATFNIDIHSNLRRIKKDLFDDDKYINHYKLNKNQKKRVKDYSDSVISYLESEYYKNLIRNNDRENKNLLKVKKYKNNVVILLNKKNNSREYYVSGDHFLNLK